MQYPSSPDPSASWYPTGNTMETFSTAQKWCEAPPKNLKQLDLACWFYDTDLFANGVILAEIRLLNDSSGYAEDFSVLISSYHPIASYAEPANHTSNRRFSGRKMNRSNFWTRGGRGGDLIERS
jgi:hypothetical protein